MLGLGLGRGTENQALGVELLGRWLGPEDRGSGATRRLGVRSEPPCKEACFRGGAVSPAVCLFGPKSTLFQLPGLG